MIFARSKLRLLIVSAILVMALGSACHATLLGLTSMFPSTQGENGWYARAFNPGTVVWRNLEYYSPKNFRTNLTAPYYLPTVYYSSTKGVLLLPGISSTYGTEWAVLSYAAPSEGDYSFSVEFANAAGGGGCTTRALVFVNNSFSAPVVQSAVNLNTTAHFAYTVHLQAGDCLNFAVDPLGSQGADSTLLRDIAPAVPEPASVMVLAAGLVGLVVRRRK